MRVWVTGECANINQKLLNKLIIDLCCFSGGPLSVLSDGRYYLLGITSAGFDCARPLQPGIYHNVQKTYKWIQNIIYNNS